jgi:hypothetical protein
MQGQAFQSDNGFFNVNAPAWQIQAATLGDIAAECPGVEAIDISQLPQGNYSMLLNGTCSMISALLNGSFSTADQCLMGRLSAATSGSCVKSDAGKTLLLVFGYAAIALLGTILAIKCLAGQRSGSTLPAGPIYWTNNAYKQEWHNVTKDKGQEEEALLDVDRADSPVAAQHNAVAVTIGAGAGAYVTYQHTALNLD